MKEELTTAMHGEFTVSRSTEIKHKAFAVWTLLGDIYDVEEITRTAEDYDITYEQAMQHKDAYFRLDK